MVAVGNAHLETSLQNIKLLVNDTLYEQQQRKSVHHIFRMMFHLRWQKRGQTKSYKKI